MTKPKPIDLDRGVHMKTAAGVGTTVCMYADEPGVYYAPNGIPVSAELARAAGFDVDADLKERARQDKRKKALEDIDREFGVMAEGEVAAEVGEFAVVHVGGGWFEVQDANGDNVGGARMRRDQAEEFAGTLVVGAAEKEAVEKK